MKRPALAPGQEWVWDYPRPPLLEPSRRVVRVELAGVMVVRSERAWRVLETSHPPVYYVPPEDIAPEALAPATGRSWCEWKGEAIYHDLLAGDTRIERAAWSYPAPNPAFGPIAGYVAFYPGKTDACYLDDERVRPQPGAFYGGWITDEIVGPFKGGPGTSGW